MRYRIIPIFMFIVCLILSSYVFLNLNINTTNIGWLFYSIWSLVIAAAISYFICVKFIRFFSNTVSFIIQFVMTLFFYLLLLSTMTTSFTVQFLNRYETYFCFRPITHVIQAPVISVTILKNSDSGIKVVQKNFFWGFFGFSELPKWQQDNYSLTPEKDATTLEYALSKGDSHDFITKFQVLLDTQAYSIIGKNSTPLVISQQQIAETIANSLPKNNRYDAIDILIAIGALDLLDKITGGDSNQQLDGADDINFNDNQLYRYYRLGKAHNKIRLIKDKYFNSYYLTDYFEQAINHCDEELLNDLIDNHNSFRAIYLVLAIQKVRKLGPQSTQYPKCAAMIKTIVNLEPFSSFEKKINGQSKFNYNNRSLADIGYAVGYNGVDISFMYDGVLEGLKEDHPEIYDYMKQHNYTDIYYENY